MSLTETIKEKMKEAMKAKDQERVTTLRGIMAGFTNELVSQKRTPQDTLGDEDALAVIKRLAKQRKDAIQQFTDGGRVDLAENEARELEIIEEFLPALMTKEAIEPIARVVIDELGATDKSQMGRVMGEVMKRTAGQADGNDVKEVVLTLLA